MRMLKNETARLYAIADNVSVIIVYTGGVADVLMGDAMTISEQKKIRMIKLIQINHQESYGVTGINQENRRIGAEAGVSIQYHIVKISSNMKVQRWKIA